MAWSLAHDDRYQADVPVDGAIGPPWYRLRDWAVREDFAARGADGSRGPGGENYPWALRNIRQDPKFLPSGFIRGNDRGLFRFFITNREANEIFARGLEADPFSLDLLLEERRMAPDQPPLPPRLGSGGGGGEAGSGETVTRGGSAGAIGSSDWDAWEETETFTPWGTAESRAPAALPAGGSPPAALDGGGAGGTTARSSSWVGPPEALPLRGGPLPALPSPAFPHRIRGWARRGRSQRAGRRRSPRRRGSRRRRTSGGSGRR